MVVIWLFSAYLLVLSLKVAKGTTLLSKYHQDDYNVKLEILNIAYWNQSYAKDPKLGLVFFNRTQKVINGSGYLLMDLTSNLKVNYQLYKFMSNEYRFFPLTIDINFCDEYDRDTLGTKTFTEKVSNFRGCPAKKGFYYIRNGVYDNSQLPPYIPHGSYKAVIKVYHNKDFIVEIHCTGTVSEKPIKWND